MTKLPRLTARQIISALQKTGFLSRGKAGATPPVGIPVAPTGIVTTP